MRKNPKAYASVNATTGEEIPVRVTKPQMDAAIKAGNWRTVSADKLDYGWLLPNGRGIDLNYYQFLGRDASQAAINAASRRADPKQLRNQLQTVTSHPISGF